MNKEITISGTIKITDKEFDWLKEAYGNNDNWITCDQIKEVAAYSGQIKTVHKWHKYKTSKEIMQWITDCFRGTVDCDCILCEEKRKAKENDK